MKWEPKKEDAVGHKRGINRDQTILFPEVVDDYISDENPVRFIDAYVDSLDVMRLGFQHAQPAKTGCPPYDPRDLLKLYLYGYLNRIRSSRELEKATQRNVEVMWLIRRLKPDFKTIADYRKDNLEAMKKVCREFTMLCKRLDLFGGELVGIDGSKFSAVNHNSRSYTKKKLQRLLQEIDKKIEYYFLRLESADTDEGREGEAKRSKVSDLIANLQEHRARLEALQHQLEESGETSVSLTDAESRMMKTEKHGNDVGYNVQIAVDAKHKLIIASDVTNEGNDLHQLSPIAQAAKETLGVESLDVTADKGYYNERQIAECEQQKIWCYIPEQEKSKNKALGLYTDKDFFYEPVKDTYRCPAQQHLGFRFEFLRGEKTIRVYEASYCTQCKLRDQCTLSKSNNRRIYRWEHEDIIEAMRERMRDRPGVLEKRKELVEHPFGTIKHGMNQDYFLMRGKQKVATEVAMSVLVYNMKRVMNILGVPTLLAKLKALSVTALRLICFVVYRRLYLVDRMLYLNT